MEPATGAAITPPPDPCSRFGAAMLAQVSLHAEPVVISDLVEAKALVESVDMKTRAVLLRGDSGELDTIIAGTGRAQPRRVHPGRLRLDQPAQIGFALEISKPGSTRSLALPKQSRRAPLGAATRGVRTESSMRGTRSRESTLPTGQCPSSDRHGSLVPCRSGTNACSTSWADTP